MNKFLVAIASISMLSNISINAGFNAETIINTPYGPKAIGALAAGDKIICMNKRFEPKEKTVKTVEDTESDIIVEITTHTGTILQASPNQQMYVATKRSWIPAYELALGDILITQDKKPVRVRNIRLIEEKTKLRFITVDKHENFAAGKEGIISHNGKFAGAIAYGTTKTLCYATALGAAATLAFTTIVPAAGTIYTAGTTLAALEAGTAGSVLAPIGLAAVKTITVTAIETASLTAAAIADKATWLP